MYKYLHQVQIFYRTVKVRVQTVEAQTYCHSIFPEVS